MGFDPNGVDNRDARWVTAAARVADAVIRPYHRGVVRGLDRIPDGPVLYVGNHNAGLNTPDTWILLGAVHRERGMAAVPYGLGHDLVMKAPLLGRALARFGGVRAHAGVAKRLFAAGHKMLVYPGGDIEAMRPFRRRHQIVFGGRTGYIRLALSSGVPVVPMVAAGAHSTFLVLHDNRWLARLLGADRWARMKVWPLTLSIPWGLSFGPAVPYISWPTRILIEVLEPIRFERSGDEAAADDAYVRACADHVEGRMQEALTRLAEERRALRRHRWRSPR